MRKGENLVGKIANRILQKEYQKQQRTERERRKRKEQEEAIANRIADQKRRKRHSLFMNATNNLRKMLNGEIFREYFLRLFRKEQNQIKLVEVAHGSHTIPGVFGATESREESTRYWLSFNKECDFIFKHNRGLFGPYKVNLANVPSPVWKEVKKALIALSKPGTTITFLKKKFGLYP
jgi:hypothetical protein